MDFAYSPRVEALRQQLRAELPAGQRQELDDIDANLAALGNRLREQAAAPAAGVAVR